MHRDLLILLLLAALTRVNSLGYSGKHRGSLYAKTIASCLEQAKYPCRTNTGYQHVEYVNENPYTYQSSKYGYGVALGYGGKGQSYIKPYSYASVEVTEITCIPKHQLCDGIIQCPFNDDEEDCPAICSSSKGEVKCPDGVCAIPCNGKKECLLGEDEINCAVCPHDKIGCTLAGTGEMGCATVCDDKVECEDDLDETLCKPKCDDDEVICLGDKSKGKYICAKPCDGNQECDNNEDEENCRIKFEEERVCLSGQFGCPACENFDFCQALVIRGIIVEADVEDCRETFNNSVCAFIEFILDIID